MVMDRMVRLGQIGGYGHRMKGVYNVTAKPTPIFEFVDLANANSGGLAQRMADFNQQVVTLHKKAVSVEHRSPILP